MTDKCKKAIKLLEQFERLARKYGIRISLKRLQALKNKRDRGTIKSTDLPAKLRGEFPSEFAGKTLDTIRKECSQ
jgi:hypothetical protein